jgi:hypothetical protein
VDHVCATLSSTRCSTVLSWHLSAPAVVAFRSQGHRTRRRVRPEFEYRSFVEVVRRYSNRPDLFGPLLEVLRRAKEGDRTDEPGGVQSREASSRPSDRLSEADVCEIAKRFRRGEPKHRLAAEFHMSLSTMKRLLRRSRKDLLR